MIVRLFAIALILIGLGGFFMSSLVGYVVNNPGALEMPLSEISDVAVSTDNQLFFALTFAHRIQKYSREGEFVGNFKINSAGGYFCIDLVADRLVVSVVRRNAADEFDLTGRSLRVNTPVDKTKYEGECALDSTIRSVASSFEATTVNFAEGPPVTINRKIWLPRTAPFHFLRDFCVRVDSLARVAPRYTETGGKTVAPEMTETRKNRGPQ